MARKTPFNPSQRTLLEGDISTAPLVPAIEGEVRLWRAKGYPGTTATTLALLRHWFKPGGHRRGNGFFEYHDGQREAVETIVWLHEVAKERGNNALFERFSNTPGLRLLRSVPSSDPDGRT